MAVITTQDRITYAGDGISTVLAVPFEFFLAGDLLVTRQQISTGGSSQLALNIDYTVQNAGNAAGGSITLAVASSVGFTYAIILNPTLTQQSNYPSNSPFPSGTMQNDLDRHMQISQRLADRISRALTAPDSDANPLMQLPTAAQRAGTFLIFDANGNPGVAVSLPSGTLSQATIAAFLNPQTGAESGAGVTPANLVYAPGRATRYGADPTGATDTTTALITWIKATWAMFLYVDVQGLWNGGGGAVPVAVLPPGKYQVSNTITVPSSTTVRGEGHPANTVSHTRLVLNSTGITPVRTWVANAVIPPYANIQALVGGTTYRFSAGAAGGTSGAGVPTWNATLNSTTADGTVTWTNGGAVTAGDNRNNPILKASRATTPGGGVIQNQYFTSTFEWLELWSVTYSNSFTSPLSGASPTIGDYPLGGALYFDVDTIDTRISECCFQNTPCSLRVNNIQYGSNGSDGFANTGEFSLFVEACEFDAAGAHVWVSNVGSVGHGQLDLHFKNCAFYGSIHKYENCVGSVIYDNCRFYGGATIDASASNNSFTRFRIANCEFEQTNNRDLVSVYGANILDIKNCTVTGATGLSTFVANLCSGGAITGNSINDSGYNAAATTGVGAAAAIKMIDCFNMGVLANAIGATDTASYNGFGILLVSSGRGSQNNFVSGNFVTAPYNAATYNGQNRYINITAADIRGDNTDNGTGAVVGAGSLVLTGSAWVKTRLLTTSNNPVYGVTNTIDVSLANEFNVVATNATAFTISNPSNIAAGADQRITITVCNYSGGALGAVTWGSNYKLAAFTAPANGYRRSIDFTFDGVSLWREVARTPADVPN